MAQPLDLLDGVIAFGAGRIASASVQRKSVRSASMSQGRDSVSSPTPKTESNSRRPVANFHRR
jgi:hypothetical protein